MAIEEDVDLSGFEGFTGSKPGYRHRGRVGVGWLDGHASAHARGHVNRRGDVEDGWALRGNERLIYWNRY